MSSIPLIMACCALFPPPDPMPQDEFVAWAERFIERLPDRSKLTMRLADYRKTERVVRAALETQAGIKLAELDNTLAELDNAHDLRMDIIRTYAITDENDLKLLKRLRRRSRHKHFDDSRKVLLRHVNGIVAIADEYADWTHRTRSAIEGAQRAYERKVAKRKTRSQGAYGNAGATDKAQAIHRGRMQKWAAARDRQFDTILGNMRKRKLRIEGAYDEHIMWLFERIGRSKAIVNVTKEQLANHFSEVFDLDEYVRAVREGEL